MRGMLLGGLVLLLTATMANAFVIDVSLEDNLGNVVPKLLPNQADQQIVLKISGSETQVTGITIEASFPEAGDPLASAIKFTGHVARGAAVGSNGGWPMDASSADAGLQLFNQDFSSPSEGTSTIESDYGMQPSGTTINLPSVATIFRKLTVSTVGNMGGDSVMSWTSVFGNAKIAFLDGSTLDYAGDPVTIGVLPEPAALALLAIGGLFIRRRHA